MLSILCKVFKTLGLRLLYSSDKNTRRLAGLLTMFCLLYWACQGGWNTMSQSETCGTRIEEMLNIALLVLRRQLDVIDDDDLYRSFRWDELEAKLLLQR